MCWPSHNPSLGMGTGDTEPGKGASIPGTPPVLWMCLGSVPPRFGQCVFGSFPSNSLDFRLILAGFKIPAWFCGGVDSLDGETFEFLGQSKVKLRHPLREEAAPWIFPGATRPAAKLFHGQSLPTWGLGLEKPKLELPV